MEELRQARVLRQKTIWEMLNVLTIAASASELSSNLDLIEAVHLALTVECTYHSSATAGITVYVYTSTDQKNWDTDELTSFSPSFTAGASVRKTVFIDPDADTIRCKVTNGDGTYTVSNVRIRATVTKEEVSFHEGK